MLTFKGLKVNLILQPFERKVMYFWILDQLISLLNYLFNELYKSTNLYSCEIMTQSIWVESAWGTLKAKRNSTSFNWCIGQCNQSYLMTAELVWDELSEKSENTDVRLTSGNSCRKTGKNYIQPTSKSLAERMPWICEAMIATKGWSILMNLKLQIFLKSLICI